MVKSHDESFQFEKNLSKLAVFNTGTQEMHDWLTDWVDFYSSKNEK